MYHPIVGAYQIGEGSVDNFSVHKDYKLDIRQTTDRRKTRNFLLQFLSPRGPKHAKLKFQLDRKKKNFGDCSNICPPFFLTNG